MDRILNLFLVIALLCHPYVQSHGYFDSDEDNGYGHWKPDKQWDFHSDYKEKTDHHLPTSKYSGEESDFSDYSGYFDDTTDKQRHDKQFEHPSNGFPHFGPQYWDSTCDHGHHGHHGHHEQMNHHGWPNQDYNGHPMNNFGHHGSSTDGVGYPTMDPVHQNKPSMNQFHQIGSNPRPNNWENKFPTIPSTLTSRPTSSQSSTASPRQSTTAAPRQSSTASFRQSSTAPPRHSSTPIPLAVLMCIRSCPVTSEFNPVCGSNNMTYNNIGRLECAQNCGVAVTVQRSSPCTIPTTLAPISNPSNNGNSRPGPNTPRTTTFPTFETKPTRYTTIDFAPSSRPGVDGNRQPAQPGRPVNPNSGVTIAPDVLASIFPGNPPKATDDYDGDIDIRFES